MEPNISQLAKDSKESYQATQKKYLVYLVIFFDIFFVCSDGSKDWCN